MQLEQETEDLSRRHREAAASVELLTQQLEKQLETNALLNTELEAIRTLHFETAQRLKQDLRGTMLVCLFQ